MFLEKDSLLQELVDSTHAMVSYKTQAAITDILDSNPHRHDESRALVKKYIIASSLPLTSANDSSAEHASNPLYEHYNSELIQLKDEHDLLNIEA